MTLMLARAAPADDLGIVGRSAAIRQVRDDIRRYANAQAPVVIHGETGTGKELVARALHNLSHRAGHPFVAANVAAIHRETMVSELFGHERGAFTGAVARHRGLLERADKGTAFLDEFGELAPDAQAMLLRAMETGEVCPVGGERPRHVSVRLVVATHRDLGAMVREGTLRPDLFFRLHVLAIEVPPLRRRMEDLPLLIAHLLERHREEFGDRAMSVEGLALLADYAWPGNVRQLANVLRRAAVRSDRAVLGANEIGEALRAEPRADGECAEAACTLTIEAVLEATGGKIAPAAKRLGIARSTLRSRMRKLGIRTE